MKAIPVKKGDRYAMLTIIRELPRINKNVRRVEVRCDCGAKKPMNLGNLRSGNSFSCGCRKVPSGSANPNFRHGVAAHPLYHAIQRAIGRCTNPNDVSYHNYGKRGIAVCDLWRKDPAAFVKWGLAKGWYPGLYLDRKENDDDYRPGNCRFVTPKISSNNRRALMGAPPIGEKQNANEIDMRSMRQDRRGLPLPVGLAWMG